MVIQQQIKLFKAPNTIITVKKKKKKGNVQFNCTYHTKLNILIKKTTTFFFVRIYDRLVVAQIKIKVINKKKKKMDHNVYQVHKNGTVLKR